MSQKRIVVGVGLVVVMLGALYCLFRSKPARETVSMRIIGLPQRSTYGFYQWKCAFTNQDHRDHFLVVGYVESLSSGGIHSRSEPKFSFSQKIPAYSGKEVAFTEYHGMDTEARVVVLDTRMLTETEYKIYSLLRHAPRWLPINMPKASSITSDWYYVTAPEVSTAGKAVIAPNASLNKSVSIK